MTGATLRDIREEKLRLADERAVRMARESLLNFTIYTKPDYDVNWHHRVACKYLDMFVEGIIRRLIFISPPRHGKSELVSRRLPAYIFGKRPDSKVISASYGADLARMMNRDVQRIIDTPRYQAIFPGVGLFSTNIRTVAQGTALRNSEIFEIVGRGGTYRCAGVGGGITGMGADYAIIDDPIKNQEEADSEVYRQKVWDWYTSTLYTRLEKDDHILLTLTRWNEDDLAGRLLQQMKTDPDADQWVVIHFEAVKEEVDHPDDPREYGEALWVNKYDNERMKKIKATAGTDTWNALFQGRPSSVGGGIIKRAWFKDFHTLPKLRLRLIQSWDTANKKQQTNDWTVCITWLETELGYFILDVYRERLEFPDLIKAMKDQNDKWNPDTIVVEDAASGTQAVQVLQRETKLPVVGRPVGTDLVLRTKAVSATVEAGNVHVPVNAEWKHDFFTELMGFPKAKHDDQVSAFDLGLEELTEGAGTWQDEMGIGETMTSAYEREMANV